jgi:hypothetical protein
MRGLLQTDLAQGANIQYAYLEFKTFGPIWLALGKKNVSHIMETSSSGKFLHGDSNLAVGSHAMNIMFGAQIFGSFMKDKLHFSLVFQNASQGGTSVSAFTGNDPAFNSWQHYGLGFKLQFDPLGKWKQGEEWLQTKKMKAMVNISVYWEPSRPTTSTTTNARDDNKLKGLFAGVFELGFTVSKFYLQAGMEYAHAGYLSNTGSQQHLASKLGIYADAAFTVNKYFVPALRFQTYNSGGTEGFANRSTGSENRSISRIHFTANIYPYGLGHRLKLQPEFIVEFADKSTSAATGAENANTYDKDVKFRATATLNF